MEMNYLYYPITYENIMRKIFQKTKFVVQVVHQKVLKIVISNEGDNKTIILLFSSKIT